MRTFGKVLLGILILLGIAITFTVGWRPFIGPRTRPLTNRKFEATSERLARGKYLVLGLYGCVACHSEHDWKIHGGPEVAGTELGGQIFPAFDLPGRVVAPNISPDPETGAGNWSDDQLARAIREGVGHDGRALFPIMPYPEFRNMPDEDLAATIVYIRSLPPVRHALPKTEIDFPVRYLIRSLPQPVEGPVAAPDLSDPVKRGAYLASMATCSDCHTLSVRGQPVAGLEYAGGAILSGPYGTVASANLTPDPSGIPYYDEALFIQAMRTGYVKARAINSIMPFEAYKNLNDDDLKAMFAFLKTLKPVKHRVDNSEPRTLCKLCKHMHGAGDQN